jgi:phosphoribosylaminoimidazole-succinocarboxamide synthase
MMINGLHLVHQGKVRDTYDLGAFADGESVLELLLMVATNRVSTHNVVHESTIEKKGEVLTALSTYWMTTLLEREGVPHHMVACGRDIYKYLPKGIEYPEDLHLRAMVVRKLTMISVEFIFRRHLTGSLFTAYLKGEDPYGLQLPPELSKMCWFETPLFTPTDKSETDEPLQANEVYEEYREAFDLGFEAFLLVEQRLSREGITLVDSKFELGVDEHGKVYLADEIATPDSSRFVMTEDIVLGKDPPWFDKQVLRDEAERVWDGGKKVPLRFSERGLEVCMKRYLDLFTRATDTNLSYYQRHELHH